MLFNSSASSLKEVYMQDVANGGKRFKEILEQAKTCGQMMPLVRHKKGEYRVVGYLGDSSFLSDEQVESLISAKKVKRRQHISECLSSRAETGNTDPFLVICYVDGVHCSSVSKKNGSSERRLQTDFKAISYYPVFIVPQGSDFMPARLSFGPECQSSPQDRADNAAPPLLAGS